MKNIIDKVINDRNIIQWILFSRDDGKILSPSHKEIVVIVSVETLENGLMKNTNLLRNLSAHSLQQNAPNKYPSIFKWYKTNVMVKVKTFLMNSHNPLHHERLDKLINKFFEENDIDVIDIKYSTAAVAGANGVSWIPSAMLIYKEK